MEERKKVTERERDKIHMNESTEFQKYEWSELVKDLIDDIKRNEKYKKISEDHQDMLNALENNPNEENRVLYFPHISHVYLMISRKAMEFLVKYRGNPVNLEKGYQNLLELISYSFKFNPKKFPFKEKEEGYQSREDQTQHLFKNRELLNMAMDNYVREIERLRTEGQEELSNKILYWSMWAGVGSMLAAILLFVISCILFLKELGIIP